MPAVTSRSSAWPLPSEASSASSAEIDRLRAQAQRAALAVGDRRERRDQLLELLRGLDDLLQVHGVVARDAAHALDRAGEPEGRGQGRAEVVTGVDDEVREIAGFSAHGRPRVMDAARRREAAAVGRQVARYSSHIASTRARRCSSSPQAGNRSAPVSGSKRCSSDVR